VGSTAGADDGTEKTGSKFGVVARIDDGAGTGGNGKKGTWTGNAEGAGTGTSVGPEDIEIGGVFFGLDNGSIVGRDKGCSVGASEGCIEGRNTGKSVGTLKGGSDSECARTSEGVSKGNIDGGVRGVPFRFDVGIIVGRDRGISLGDATGCPDGAYVGTCIGYCELTTLVEIAEGFDVDEFEELISGIAAEGNPGRDACSGAISLLIICLVRFVGAATGTLSSEGTTGVSGSDGTGTGSEEVSITGNN
jgi:hypothetical protein